ncbi:MAG: HEAT repeat domain-containing protein [Candidatus Lokiarchaeota archaeon]|nr:HEAT repeat domain-containing protein [Candidatus Lokiarchaeota archaeon]
MDPDIKKDEFNNAIQKLFHGEIMERAAAARKLGHLKEGRAVNLLIKAINKEKDVVVINRIIEAMGEIRNTKSTLSILKFLSEELEKTKEDQDKARLFLIIDSLMKIGDKRALQQLGLLIDSCDADIRERTEQAFECIDVNWRENIKKLKI